MDDALFVNGLNLSSKNPDISCSGSPNSERARLLKYIMDGSNVSISSGKATCE